MLDRLVANIPGAEPEERRRREAYVRRKKWPQVLWMAERVREILAEVKRKRPGPEAIRVADIGAGRGDLSLALALKFSDCEFVVIDVNEQSLSQGKALAKKLGVKNVAFLLQDLTSLAQEFDLYVGLHACGGLTDAILERVATQESPASFLVCTCCFGKNKALRPGAWNAAFCWGGSSGGASGGHGEGKEDSDRAVCRLADSCEYGTSR